MTFLTTRFTTETLAENLRYRDTHQEVCIYGLGVPISDKHPHTPLYVLEMNNSTNELVGIGIITKKIYPRVQIYQNPYYNRYIYKGNHYIPASELPQDIREELETKLFKGRSHLKRGKSMTQFPSKWLKKEYYDIFLTNFTDNIISAP
jgi:hypothetical protein